QSRGDERRRPCREWLARSPRQWTGEEKGGSKELVRTNGCRAASLEAMPVWVVKCQPIHYPFAPLKIKIAQFGLGPIGLETLKLAATKPWAEIVGVIDLDPSKAGTSLGELPVIM